jgi:hypothetical protein
VEFKISFKVHLSHLKKSFEKPINICYNNKCIYA